VIRGSQRKERPYNPRPVWAVSEAEPPTHWPHTAKYALGQRSVSLDRYLLFSDVASTLFLAHEIVI
jgi:hypothetical protein